MLCPEPSTSSLSSYSLATDQIELSVPFFPAAASIRDVIQAFRDTDVVLIDGPTGSGKSSLIPLALAEQGERVIVIERTIPVVRSVAKYVASLYGTPLGDHVGYRTAYESRDSQNSRVVYCTDGLQLVRELLGNPQRTTILFDDFHHFNGNCEVLIGWMKLLRSEGIAPKIGFMSGTLNESELQEHFEGSRTVKIEFECFPVEEQKRQQSLEIDAAQRVAKGQSILIFQPGKQEIQDCIDSLEKLGVNAEILPLHSELAANEQERCFVSYSRPKVVVATNIAQEGLTIKDIDVVLDSGMEKRIEIQNGVEGLVLRPISLADRRQRMGRVGRTHAGVYVDYCSTPLAQRSPFPIPEIKRTLLDTIYLRVLSAGFRLDQLPLIHAPNPRELEHARDKLRLLGCISRRDNITNIGRSIARYPVSAAMGRMIYEAENSEQFKALAIVGLIAEQGGIVDRNSDVWRDEVRGHTLWIESSSARSDQIAQLLLFEKFKDLPRYQLIGKGLTGKSVERVRDALKLFLERMGPEFRQPVSLTSELLEQIHEKIPYGFMDNLMVATSEGKLVDRHGTEREIGSAAIVSSFSSRQVLAGLAFDVEVSKGRHAGSKRYFAGFLSPVPSEFLAHVRQLITTESNREPRYDQVRDEVMSITRSRLNGRIISEELRPDPRHPDANKLFLNWLNSSMTYPPTEETHPLFAIAQANKTRNAETQSLNIRAGQELIPEYIFDKGKEYLAEQIGVARALHELRDMNSLRFPSVDDSQRQQILEDNPDKIIVPGLGEHDVLYAPQQPPTISLQVNPRVLPEGSITLPGGRTVHILVTYEGVRHGPKASMTEVKDAARQWYSEKLTKELKSRGTETIEFCSVSEDIPPILQENLGADPFTDTDVIAYRYLSKASGYHAKSQWTTDRTKAEAAHDETRDALFQYREEQQQIKLRRDAEAAAALLRQQQIEQGTALANFSGVSSNPDFKSRAQEVWVIDASGKIVKPSSSVTNYPEDGIRHTWNFVGPECLVLCWSTSWKWDPQRNSEFRCEKLPVEGCTEAQLKKVQEIEQQLGVRVGSFGLDAAENELRRTLLTSLQEQHQFCSVCQTEQEWTADDLHALFSKDGIHQACCDDNQDKISEAKDRNMRATETCEGRPAWRLEVFVYGNIAVDVLTFQTDEWSTPNKVHLRARVATEHDKAVSANRTDLDTEDIASMLKTSGLFSVNQKKGKDKKGRR